MKHVKEKKDRIKKIRNGLWMKGLTIGLIMLFIGASVTPYIITNVKADITTDLVGYWSFNDGTATDSSSKHHNGIIHGGPQLVSGKVNGALHFDGVYDFIQLRYSRDFDFGTGDFSFALWFNQDIQGGGTNSNYRQLLCKRIPGSGYNYNFECQIQNDRLEIPIGDTTGYTNLEYHNISLHTWYHICVVRQSGVLQLYINGNLIDSKSCPYDLSFTRDLYIGNDDYKYENWGGIIDEVRIYNRALTQNDVNELYAQGSENQPSPNITGPAKGKVGINNTYNFIAIDPNGVKVLYFIDWGDNTNSSWLGPYPSGEQITQSHTWSVKGIYTIKAKAKNIHGNESDWATLSITMPHSFSNSLPKFLSWLFQWFPNEFPISKYLLGY